MQISAESVQQMLERETLSLDLETYDETMRYTILNLSRTLISKCTDVEESYAEKAALDGFQESVALCGNWALKCENEWDRSLIRHFRRLATVEDFGLSFIDWSLMFQHGGTGPGVSSGSQRTDFFGKLFDGPLTTSHAFLIPLYKRYIAHFPEWARGEELRASKYGDVVVVGPSQVSTVAKKRTVRRTILTMPTLDMWFQLGLGRLLSERLKMLGIRLKDQQFVNRGLAQSGSTDGKTATIDLRNASDRISRRMCTEFFPCIAGLMASVSPSKCKMGRKFLPLTMLGTMGNGATFPLMTLVFCTVVRACLANRQLLDERPLGQPRGRSTLRWGVFGDDICCPSIVYEDVCRLCHLLGFEVNVDKSYNNGSFRESCGGDFLNGYNVRGIYTKSLLHPHDRFSLANRLVAWCSRHRVYLPLTIGHLLDAQTLYRVPMWSQVTEGLRVPWGVSHMPKNGHYYAWKQNPETSEHAMEGNDGLYVAFIGQYLRTPYESWLDDQRSQSSYKCVQQGRMGIFSFSELERVEEDVPFWLRSSNCPGHLWDGMASDGVRSVGPDEASRTEEFILQLVVRR